MNDKERTCALAQCGRALPDDAHFNRRFCSTECKRANPKTRDSKRAQQRAAAKAKRDQLVAEGRCPGCGRDPLPGKKMCTDCLNTRRESARRNYSPLASRARSLRYSYRMTVEDYDRMLISQSGRCLICGTDDPDAASWSVDHDHRCCPGKRSCGACVRGLLCRKCNTGIGLLGDDPQRLIQAYNYLTTYERRPA